MSKLSDRSLIVVSIRLVIPCLRKLFKIKLMAYLTERQKIELLMMVGYDDRLQSHAEACHLFNQKHSNRPPIKRFEVSKLVAEFNEHGSVKDLLSRSGRPS